MFKTFKIGKKMNEVGGLVMKGKHEKIMKVLKAWI